MEAPIAVGAPTRRRLAWAALTTACLVAGGGVSCSLGQDASWDLRNYHLYNPWAYLAGRMSTDLFAAGIQTFFSPYLDIPYYLLATRWLPSHPALIAFIMGLPFGALMVLSFTVAWVVASDHRLALWTRVALCALAAGFGLTGASVLSQIGTTTNEIPVSVLVMAGLLTLLVSGAAGVGRRRAALGQVLLAGLLFGAAASLKLTATLYAPGAAAACLIKPGAAKHRLLRLGVFCLAWSTAFLAIWAPWALQVARLTGSPTFPLLNDVFRSRWVAPTGFRDGRFLPGSLLQTLFYPFYWLTPNTDVMELPFADPRFAAAFAVLVLCGAAWLLRRPAPADGAPFRPLVRTRCLVAFTIISYVVWEALFSILRYAVPIESVLGTLLFASVLGAVPWPPASLRRGAVPLLAAVSLLAILTSEHADFGRAAYGKTVFQTHIPDIAPGAVVLLVGSPIAFAAPFIHLRQPTASFVGLPAYVPSGGFSGFELVRRIKARIDSANPLYVLSLHDDPTSRQIMRSVGVSVDAALCRPLTSNISDTLDLCAAIRQETPR